MPRSDGVDKWALHLCQLREYVLTPTETAIELAEQERTELKAEENALDEFAERVEAMTPPLSKSPAVRQQFNTQTASTLADVREAYRNTVMSVPHFEDQYDESLIEHISEELSYEVASVLHPTTATDFTTHVQNSIQQATRHRASRRRALIKVLDREISSLTTAHTRLRDLIERVSGRGIPICSSSTIAEELQEIATTRQQVLGERPSLEMARITEVCSYLYASQSWTHPVLVSVSRLHEAAIT